MLGLCLSALLTFPGCSGNGGEDAATDSGSESRAETSGINPEETNAPQPKVKRVIMIVGQSNAVGHSQTKYLPDAQKKISPERVMKARRGWENIRMMYSHNPYIATTEKTDDFLPVTFGYGVKKDANETFGPEVGLAEYLDQRFPGEEFYIIKCATGGSNLCEMWNPITLAPNSLYTEMLDFTKQALGVLEEDGSKAEIIGFLWMQGESDATRGGTNYDSRFEGYNELFGALLDGFCKEFSDYLPNGAEGMAVIQAGISTFWRNHTAMNQAKQRFCNARENASYFGTYDLTYDLDNTDHGHYDAAGMIILGNRFGEHLVNVLEKIGKF